MTPPTRSAPAVATSPSCGTKPIAATAKYMQLVMGRRPWLKLDDYDLIKPNMCFFDVVMALGVEATETARTTSTFGETVTYEWTNGDGSRMTAVFTNDRLVTKAQAGLKR